MKAHVFHRPSSRSLALALLTMALLVAATIAAAFTREAETEAARANADLPHTVFLAGARGTTGELIAEQAIDEGFALRAASGDLRDARTAYQSVRGAAYVVCGLAGQVWEGPETPDFIGYRAFVNLVNGARAAGVRHFVLISSVWAGLPTDESFQSRAGPLTSWKRKAEEYLKASGVPYTIMGPGTLRGEAASATGLRIVRREDYQAASVARADVARVAIDSLRNPIARNKSFALFNDEEALPDSWRKELYAVRRDAPTGAWLKSGIGATATPGATQSVIPAPRERLMIEEDARQGEPSAVGWTPPSRLVASSTITE